MEMLLSVPCAVVFQARGCEDLPQSQVHVHPEDPPVRGAWEHRLQLTSGNVDARFSLQLLRVIEESLHFKQTSVCNRLDSH